MFVEILNNGEGGYEFFFCDGEVECFYKKQRKLE